MKRFLNVKTLGVAAVAVIAVVVIYPGALVYLPLLLFAACPLMMMGGGHAGHGAETTAPGSRDQLGEYVCAMHPEIKSTFPGKCPVCGMDLRAAAASTPQR